MAAISFGEVAKKLGSSKGNKPIKLDEPKEERSDKKQPDRKQTVPQTVTFTVNKPTEQARQVVQKYNFKNIGRRFPSAAVENTADILNRWQSGAAPQLDLPNAKKFSNGFARAARNKTNAFNSFAAKQTAKSNAGVLYDDIDSYAASRGLERSSNGISNGFYSPNEDRFYHENIIRADFDKANYEYGKNYFQNKSDTVKAAKEHPEFLFDGKQFGVDPETGELTGVTGIAKDAVIKGYTQARLFNLDAPMPVKLYEGTQVIGDSKKRTHTYSWEDGNSQTVIADSAQDKVYKREYLSQFMDQKQSVVYAYIYGAEGKSSADNYIDSLASELEPKARAKETAERGKMMGENFPVLSRIAEPVLAAKETVQGAKSFIKRNLGGDLTEDDYSVGIYKTYMQEGQNTGHGEVYKAVNGIANMFLDMLPSVALGGIGGAVAEAAAGTRAASAIANGVKLVTNVYNFSQGLGQRYTQLGLSGHINDPEATTSALFYGVANLIKWDNIDKHVNIAGKLINKVGTVTRSKAIIGAAIDKACSQFGIGIAQELVNQGIDAFFMGDNSEWHQRYDAYKANGKSDSEAKSKANTDIALSILQSGIVNGLMGTVYGFIDGSILDSGVHFTERGKRLDANGYTVNDIINESKAFEVNTAARRNGERLERRLERGKEVSYDMLGAQSMLNEIEAARTAEYINRLDEMTGTRTRIGRTDSAVNAEIDGRDITISDNADIPVAEAVRHEQAHRIQDIAAREYREYIKWLRGGSGSKDFADAVARTKRLHKDVTGKELSRTAAHGEVSADIARSFLKNSKALDRVQRLAEHNSSLADRIYSGVRWLRSKLRGGQVYYDEATGVRMTYKELYRAEQLFETALAEAYRNRGSDGGGRVSFSIRHDKNGNKYVVIDENQSLFSGKKAGQYNKIALNYMNERYKDTTLPLSDYNIVHVNKVGINKYGHSGNTYSHDIHKAKSKAAVELHNILEAAEYVGSSLDSKNHPFAEYGFEYYKTRFIVDNQIFDGVIDIGVSKKGATFYGMSNIKRVSYDSLPSALLSDVTPAIIKKETLNTNSIPQPGDGVKSKSEKNFSLKKSADDGIYGVAIRSELASFVDKLSLDRYYNSYGREDIIDNVRLAYDYYMENNHEAGYSKLREAGRILQSHMKKTDNSDMAKRFADHFDAIYDASRMRKVQFGIDTQSLTDIREIGLSVPSYVQGLEIENNIDGASFKNVSAQTETNIRNAFTALRDGADTASVREMLQPSAERIIDSARADNGAGEYIYKYDSDNPKRRNEAVDELIDNMLTYYADAQPKKSTTDPETVKRDMLNYNTDIEGHFRNLNIEGLTEGEVKEFSYITRKSIDSLAAGDASPGDIRKAINSVIDKFTYNSMRKPEDRLTIYGLIENTVITTTNEIITRQGLAARDILDAEILADRPHSAKAEAARERVHEYGRRSADISDAFNVFRGEYKFSKTFTNSLQNDAFSAMIENMSDYAADYMYKAQNNKEQYFEAKRDIMNRGIDNSVAVLLKKEAWEGVDTVKAYILIALYSDIGDYTTAHAISVALTRQNTRSGQQTQANMVAKKMGPQGWILEFEQEHDRYAYKQIDNMFKSFASKERAEREAAETKQLVDDAKARDSQANADADAALNVSSPEYRHKKEQLSEVQFEIKSMMEQREATIRQLEELNERREKKKAAQEERENERERKRQSKENMSKRMAEAERRARERDRQMQEPDFSPDEPVRTEDSHAEDVNVISSNEHTDWDTRHTEGELLPDEIAALENEIRRRENENVEYTNKLRALMRDAYGIKEGLDSVVRGYRINRATGELTGTKGGASSYKQLKELGADAHKLKTHLEETYDRLGIKYVKQADMADFKELIKLIDECESTSELVNIVLKSSQKRHTAVQLGDRGPFKRKDGEFRNGMLKKSLEKLVNDTDLDVLKKVAVQQVFGFLSDAEARTFGQYVKTYDIMSMLLTGSTFLRNIMSEMLNMHGITSDLAWLIDKPVSLATGKKSVSREPHFKGKLAEFKSGFERANKAYLESALNVDILNNKSDKYGKARHDRTFRRGIGAAAERGLGYSLSVTDEYLKGMYYEHCMNSLKNNTDFTDAEKKTIAMEEAKYRTFQNDTVLGKTLESLKRGLNTVNFKGYGLGDFMTPFTHVAGNVVTRTIEYSPMGMLKAVYELGKLGASGRSSAKRWAAQRKAEGYNPTRFEYLNYARKNVDAKRQRRFIHALSRPIVGTVGGIFAGYMLRKLGIVIGTSDTKDYDEREYEKSKGLGDYVLNLSRLGRMLKGDLSTDTQPGDWTVEFGWIVPLNWCLSVGSAFYDRIGETGASIISKEFWGELLDTSVDYSAEQFKDLAMYSSIYSAVNNWKNTDGLSEFAVAEAADLALRAIPAVVKQIGNSTDDYARYPYKNENVFDLFASKVKSKIPFVREGEPMRIDMWGQATLNTTGNKAIDFLNNMLFPSRVGHYQPNDLTDEFDRLGKQSKDIYPRSPYREQDFTLDGQRYTFKLNDHDYEGYKNVLGSLSYQAMHEFMFSEDYKLLSDEDRIETLSKISYDASIEVRNMWAKKQMGASNEELLDIARALVEKYKDRAADIVLEKQATDYIKQDDVNVESVVDTGYYVPYTEEEGKKAIDEYTTYIAKIKKGTFKINGVYSSDCTEQQRNDKIAHYERLIDGIRDGSVQQRHSITGTFNSLSESDKGVVLDYIGRHPEKIVLPDEVRADKPDMSGQSSTVIDLTKPINGADGSTSLINLGFRTQEYDKIAAAADTAEEKTSDDVSELKSYKGKVNISNSRYRNYRWKYRRNKYYYKKRRRGGYGGKRSYKLKRYNASFRFASRFSFIGRRGGSGNDNRFGNRFGSRFAFVGNNKEDRYNVYQ